MAITILEYNKRLDGVIKDLQSGAHGTVMSQVGSAAIEMVKERVQEKGLNPEGQKYSPYSKSYLEYKKKEGKYRGFVDFSFSNQMWRSIKLVSPKDELELGIAVIKATTPLEKEKLSKNTARRGDILALNQDEKGKLVHIYEQGILNIFRKNKLL
jgi:hypothetical protein